jgi:hypothetical protein
MNRACWLVDDDLSAWIKGISRRRETVFEQMGV